MLKTLLAAIAISGLAAEVPPPPAHYVLDQPGALSANVREGLGALLSKHETSTGEQVVIAIFNDLEGEDVVTRTTSVFERWQIGSKGKDNGVLLALYWKDRKARIEVGYGLEGTLTDALSKRVIEDALVPRLKEGDADGALQAATVGILRILESPVLQDVSQLPPERPRTRRGPKVSSGLGLLIVVLSLLVRLLGRRDAHFTRAGWTQKGWRRGRWTTGGGFLPGGGGGLFSGGSRSGGGGGGGIFSGGGGRSGGGGASGSW